MIWRHHLHTTGGEHGLLPGVAPEGVGGMPRMHRRFLDVVVYLYPSQEAAENGERLGGTGFIVGVPLPGSDDRYLTYVITCAHCLRLGGARFVRFNTRDDRSEVYESQLLDWAYHADGDDVAAIPFALDRRHFRQTYIGEELFVQEGNPTDCTYGDDVFFLGRFMAQEGEGRNVPTVRFGNVATLPQAILTDDGRRQESYLVEARSLSGYSGSPVFVYPSMTMPILGYRQSAHLKLVGMDWCHIRDYKPVLKTDKKTRYEEQLYVEQNSGMMGVIPAWKIAQLLHEDEELVKDREEIAKALREKGEHVALDVDHESHKGDYERFEELTRKLVRTPKHKPSPRDEAES